MGERLDYGDRVVVECSVCGDKFYLHPRTAEAMKKNNDGFVPCERCGSSATTCKEYTKREDKRK